MNPEMIYSKSGMALTEQFEGCRLIPYKDSSGVWTDGYGNTHGVVPGRPITKAQAAADLYANIQSAVNAVNRTVTIQLTQGEFDALVDFTFNLGAGRLESSTLLVDVNKGNWEAAATQFDLWDRCGGKEVAGLLRRRIADTNMFKS